MTTTTLNHARITRDLDKAVTTVENLREGIADILVNGSDDARDKVLAEFNNLLHEVGQGQIALRHRYRR